MAKNTVSLVWDLVKPYADELGLVLWDVCFEKEGANYYLRIFIDKEDGVGIEDYIKAISEYDRAPGQIDELTSYTGYTGESLHRTKIKEGWQSALIKLKKHRKDNDLLGVLDAVNEIFALPVARPEALLEKADRFANFISHARRYADKNNLKLDDVLDKARSDSQFFWKLYENTNKALGDYLGRNLYVPNKFYSNLGWIYPFWKFPAQTARITGGQIARHPLKFQASVLAPGKIGSAEWEKTREEYGLSPEDYTGGIPYYKSINPNIPSEVIQLGGNQYAALGDLTRMLFGTSEGGLTGFNPILSSVSRIGNVSTPFGTPASIPGTVVINGKRYDVDKYGNPIGEHEVTPLERLGFVSKEALSTLFAPYRQASLVGRPLGFNSVSFIIPPFIVFIFFLFLKYIF